MAQNFGWSRVLILVSRGKIHAVVAAFAHKPYPKEGSTTIAHAKDDFLCESTDKVGDYSIATWIPLHSKRYF